MSQSIQPILALLPRLKPLGVRDTPPSSASGLPPPPPSPSDRSCNLLTYPQMSEKGFDFAVSHILRMSLVAKEGQAAQ